MAIWLDVRRASENPVWGPDYYLYSLPWNNHIHRNFERRFPYSFTEIYKVENSKLYAKFLLKKEQYLQPEIRELYHDTEIDNIPSIMKTNLDWRRVVRAKYGQGVSFATTPQYAYGNSNGFNKKKAMIIADVLIEKVDTCCGNFPRLDYDTTESWDGNVVVKYCDDEFYPKYVIHYEGP